MQRGKNNWNRAKKENIYIARLLCAMILFLLASIFRFTPSFRFLLLLDWCYCCVFSNSIELRFNIYLPFEFLRVFFFSPILFHFEIFFYASGKYTNSSIWSSLQNNCVRELPGSSEMAMMSMLMENKYTLCDCVLLLFFFRFNSWFLRLKRIQNGHYRLLWAEMGKLNFQNRRSSMFLLNFVFDRRKFACIFFIWK